MTRIETPTLISIRVKGEGRGSELAATTDNLSAGGFYVRLGRALEPGRRLFATIRFAANSDQVEGAVRLAVRGKVLRVESLSEGVYGTAVRIASYRFL